MSERTRLEKIRERDARFPKSANDPRDVTDGFHRSGHDRRWLLERLDELEKAAQDLSPRHATSPKPKPSPPRVRLRFGDPLQRHEPICCDAAEWAVRVRPRLEALVAKAFVGDDHDPDECAFPDGELCLPHKILALLDPHEEHKETQG